MSQSPVTFLRKRTAPPTPPSLVKFAARERGEMTGDRVSTPTSDQVPDEI